MDLVHRYNKLISFVALLVSLIAMNSFADTTTYAYDDLNRLVRVEYGNRSLISYDYDELGNLLRKTTSSAALKVERAGDGKGEVTFSPEGIPCGKDCFTYSPGTAVTLTATPDDYSDFGEWTGCSS